MGVETPNLDTINLALSMVANGPNGTGKQLVSALALQVAALDPFANRLPAEGAIGGLQGQIDAAGENTNVLRNDLNALTGDVDQQAQDIQALQSTALASTPSFNTTAAALASSSVAVGGLFSVPVRANGIEYRVYRKDAGPVATLQYEVPMPSELAQKASIADASQGKSARSTLMRGTTLTTAGPALATPAFAGVDPGHTVHNGVRLTAGWLDTVTIRRWAGGDGTFELVLLAGATLTSMSVVGRRPVKFDPVLAASGDFALQAGIHFDPVYVPDGAIIGAFCSTGGATVGGVTGGARYDRLGDPGAEGGAAQTYAPNAQTLQMNASVRTDRIAGETAARKLDAASGHEALAVLSVRDGITRHGPAIPSGTDNGGTANNTSYLVQWSLGAELRPDRDVIPIEVEVFVATAGTGQLEIGFAIDTGNTPNNSATAITNRWMIGGLIAGKNVLVAGRDFPAFVLPRGARIMFRTPPGGAVLRWQFTNGATYNYAGDPGAAAVIWAGLQVSPQIALRSIPVSPLMSPWKGKVGVFVGDSWVAANGSMWIPFAAQELGLSSYTSGGESGQLLQSVTNYTTEAAVAAADIVVVQALINNWRHGNTSVGAWGDAAMRRCGDAAMRRVRIPFSGPCARLPRRFVAGSQASRLC